LRLYEERGEEERVGESAINKKRKKERKEKEKSTTFKLFSVGQSRAVTTSSMSRWHVMCPRNMSGGG